MEFYQALIEMKPSPLTEPDRFCTAPEMFPFRQGFCQIFTSQAFSGSLPDFFERRLAPVGCGGLTSDLIHSALA